MKRIALATLALLSGCATDGGSTPPPAVEVRIQRVEVPVSVPCIDKSKVPENPPKVGSELTGDARHDLDIVGASALRLRQALNEAFALIGPCTQPQAMQSTAHVGSARMSHGP